MPKDRGSKGCVNVLSSCIQLVLISMNTDELAQRSMLVQTKDQAECFDDAKGSHVSQSFIQDKEIKDIQDE